MPLDTVIDCTAGAGGFVITALMNGCNVICTDRDYNQCMSFKTVFCDLETKKHWRSLCQPLSIPTIFMKKNAKDINDLMARRKNKNGNLMTEADVRWFVNPFLLASASPDATHLGSLAEIIPASMRSKEVSMYFKEANRIYTNLRFLRVGMIRVRFDSTDRDYLYIRNSLRQRSFVILYGRKLTTVAFRQLAVHHTGFKWL